MEAKVFREWQSHLGLSAKDCSRLLGKSDDTISRYRIKGVPIGEAKIVGLACSAIAFNLKPWQEARLWRD